MRTSKHRVLVAVSAALVIMAAGCSGDETASDATDSSSAAVTTSPSLTLVPQTTVAEPMEVDQAPPASANGMVVVEDTVWVASLNGDEIIAADRHTGEILRRIGKEAGVVGPDDLALGPDGRIWWTGFTTGAVGAFDPETGVGEVVAELPPGANPIAFAPDGRLYVGLAITGEGLYEVDPSGGSDPKLVIEKPGNVNGFEVADDWRIWGPRFGTAGEGEIVAMDTETGEIEVLTDGFTANIALAIGTDGKAYVASVGPARVEVWDPASDSPPKLFAEMGTTAVDNLAFAEDGTLYVSGFDKPVLNVVGADGSVETLPLGS